MGKNKAYTLDEMKEMQAAFEKRMADARAEIAANRSEIEALKAGIESATEHGDIAQYKTLRARQADLELNIEAVGAIIAKAEEMHACGFNNADVRASWAEYVTEFNARSVAFCAEIDRQRRTLFESYLAAARIQNEALAVQDSFTALLTKDGVSFAGYPLDFAQLHGLPGINEALNLERNIDGVDERTWNSLYIVCDNQDTVENF